MAIKVIMLILPGVAAYALLSALVVILFRQIGRTWLKSTLITLYFCTTVFACVLLVACFFAFLAGGRAEDLRQSSVETSENVEILTLLRKSNASDIDPEQFYTVTHNLENEIDALLPIANHYLLNRGALCWKLSEWWGGLGRMEQVFERDLPSVVQYRENHPPVSDHGPYDSVMKTYRKPNTAPGTYFRKSNTTP
jgi:hypothetical protein